METYQYRITYRLNDQLEILVRTCETTSLAKAKAIAKSAATEYNGRLWDVFEEEQ